MPKLSEKAIYIKEYEAVVASRVRKAYICCCLDIEDSFEDEIDECMIKELAVMKASRYVFRGSYRQWETTWERVLYDCNYLTDDEFLSHFRMDRSCVMQLKVWWRRIKSLVVWQASLARDRRCFMSWCC